MLLDGHQYYLLTYNYNTDYIFTIPIKDVNNKSIMEVFGHSPNKKEERFRPTFKVTDNQATTHIKAYLKKEGYKWQFIDHINHRLNTVKRTIHPSRNHFISGLCSTDSK